MKVSECRVCSSAIRDRLVPDEVARILMREYDLREEELLETNLNHFMRHIGMSWSLEHRILLILVPPARCRIRVSSNLNKVVKNCT